MVNKLYLFRKLPLCTMVYDGSKMDPEVNCTPINAPFEVKLKIEAIDHPHKQQYVHIIGL